LYKVHLLNPAERTYRWLFKHDRQLFERICSALELLQEDPYVGKPLVGRPEGAWSLRVGVYRVLYRIEKKELQILVLDIGHRREIYR
jgi:mRNA interferase RelE/StbE